jgi:hypothetical protein
MANIITTVALAPSTNLQTSVQRFAGWLREQSLHSSNYISHNTMANLVTAVWLLARVAKVFVLQAQLCKELNEEKFKNEMLQR